MGKHGAGVYEYEKDGLPAFCVRVVRHPAFVRLCGRKRDGDDAGNVLEKAFQKDQQTFSEAFGVDFSTDAELIYGQPDNYRLIDAVELYGRTADRTDLYFVEDELLQFEYQFAFSGGEQALAEALDFAKKARRGEREGVRGFDSESAVCGFRGYAAAGGL